MKALVKNGVIYELSPVEFEVHPAFHWVDVPDDTVPRADTWNGHVVKAADVPALPAPPVFVTLDDLKAVMVLANIRAEAVDTAVSAVRVDAPVQAVLDVAR